MAETTFLPIQFRQVSGTRPFVALNLNGHPFLFMVHANANFYAMTTHQNAGIAGLGPLTKKSAYGITAHGHVSELGRADAIVDSIDVGGVIARSKKIAVFEAEQVPTMDGMLGIEWLRDKHVLVDYGLGRIALPGTDEDGPREDARLIARGYLAHKMTWDAGSKSYSVEGSVNGVAAHLQVSTVSVDILDAGFAKKANVELGPVVDNFSGPAGATGYVYIAKRPIAINVGLQSGGTAQPWIWDVAAYGSHKSNPGGGVEATIGADFMLATGAVIDFGTETLLMPAR
jgi:hypothetical protein